VTLVSHGRGRERERMKFGKQLGKGAIRRWVAFYINYNLVKTTLGGEGESNARAENASQQEQQLRGPRSVSDSFAAALQSEVHRCSSFFVEKVEELEALVKRGEGTESTDEQLAEACLEVLELRRFAFLNCMAIVKVVKKRNKVLRDAIASGKVEEISALSVLMHQSFFSCPRFGALVGTAESVFLGLSEAKTGEEGAASSWTSHGPIRRTRALGRLTVVLDLDQTMILCLAQSKILSLSRSREAEENVKSLQFWNVQMEHVRYPVKVFIRPGLREFLRGLASMNVDVIVFTAGIEAYARPILDKIEAFASIKFLRRLYRNSTTRTEQYNTVKDLSTLDLDLARTVLLDDNPMSFSLQPNNGVPVMPFSPLVSEQEGYLVQLLPVLEACEREPDVRPFLRQKYKMHGWFTQLGVHCPEEEQGERPGLQSLVRDFAQQIPVHHGTTSMPPSPRRLRMA